MIINIIIAVLLGVCAGTITGLTPGIHINLISALAVSLYAGLTNIPALYFVVFIMAMSITHTFLDSIPGIFLGVPDPDMALSILPGHRMLHSGKGIQAVQYTIFGSLFGLLCSIIIAPLLIFIIPLLYSLIKNYVGFIILGFLLLIFIKDRKRLFKSSLLFLLAGVFGILVLEMNLNEPMFHLFTGLFGTSNLFLSLNTCKIKKQEFSNIVINIKHKLSTMVSVIMGVIAAFLPGLGSSQSAVIGMSFFKKKDINDPSVFLTFVGGLNTVNMFVSLITFYTISKARNGSIIALEKIISTINLETVILIIVVVLLSAGLAVILGIRIAKLFAVVVQKINYKVLVLSIIGLIFAISLYFDLLLGFFVVVLGTFIGIFATKLGVSKSYLMGCLLIPVLLFLL